MFLGVFVVALRVNHLAGHILAIIFKRVVSQLKKKSPKSGPNTEWADTFNYCLIALNLKHK